MSKPRSEWTDQDFRMPEPRLYTCECCGKDSTTSVAVDYGLSIRWVCEDCDGHYDPLLHEEDEDA